MIHFTASAPPHVRLYVFCAYMWKGGLGFIANKSAAPAAKERLPPIVLQIPTHFANQHGISPQDFVLCYFLALCWDG